MTVTANSQHRRLSQENFFFRKKGQNPSVRGGREDFLNKEIIDFCLQRSDSDDDPEKRQ